MGCSRWDFKCDDDEKPPHQVTITKGFWLGQTEVTAGGYKRFIAATGRQMPGFAISNPGWVKDSMPMMVTWGEAHDYCTWAGGRLPTEAEWEYAARAGSTEARYGQIDEVAWDLDNGGVEMHPVGMKRANGFGLYDVLGNVDEWVNDWYDPHYYQNSPSQDPPGPVSGESRVMRGGSWIGGPSTVRVSARNWFGQGKYEDQNSGFRCGGEVFASPASSPTSQRGLRPSGVETRVPDFSKAIPVESPPASSPSAPSGLRPSEVEAPISAPTPGAARVNPKDRLKYVWIPPGTFMMGCSPGDNGCGDEEKPRHHVVITRGFWMSQTSVTVDAYKRFARTGRAMPREPYSDASMNKDFPIEGVTWNDAHAYCVWVGGRLPTEAEWEYTTRGGSNEARYGSLDDVAWYNDNSGAAAHEVAQKRANSFGLYDMLGNVHQWVNDWYDHDYYKSSPSRDPQGPTSGQAHGLRGGNWGTAPFLVRASSRFYNLTENDGAAGFRCVVEVLKP
jgi:formylglycine-generating enzyme required for sulfatase activity